METFDTGDTIEQPPPAASAEGDTPLTFDHLMPKAEAAPAAPAAEDSAPLTFDHLMPTATQSWPAALGNAAMQGVIGGTGSAMAGVGSIGSALENTAATKMLAAADAVAAGEMTPQAAMRDLTPTQRSMFSEWVTGTPEERVQWRAEMGKMLSAAPNALTSAGESVGHYGEEYKVDPGKEGWTTGGVRMAAGIVPAAAGAVAAGLVGGPTAGGMVMASTIFGQSYDMALREARAKGLPPEQADQAAIQNAVAQTAIMGVPMARLLSAVPAPLRDGVAKTLMNLGKHGVEFGSANALSRFVQNYVLREAGKPDQALTEGVMDAAAEGLIAGLIVPAAGGAVRAGARKVSDAIAPNASPELRRAMDEMEALAPETQPGRDTVPDVVRPPAAEATPPETGMPQTSTNDLLRRQAPEAPPAEAPAAEPTPMPEPPPVPKLRTIQEIIDQDGVSAKKAAEIQTAEIEAISRPVTAEEVAARKAGLSPPEAQPEIPTMVVRPEPEAPQEGRPVTSEDAMPEAHPGEDVGLAPAPEAPAVEPRAEAAPADAEGPKLDRPPPRPQDAISLLIQHGGIKDTGGDLKAMGADTIHHQRAGRLINNTRGMELDKARELLADYGYISHDTDINDLQNLIAEHIAGRPTYPAHYESERLAWEQGRAAESERDRAVDTLGDVRAVADEAGVTLTAAEQEHAARLILQGEAPNDAVYEAVRAGDADAQEAFNQARGMLSAREKALADRAGADAPSPEAAETRRRLAAVMQAVMRYAGLPSSVGLRLVDRLVDAQGNAADAAYYRGLITFALDTASVRGPGAVPAKLFHEVVHGLMDPALGILTPKQRAALLTAADRWLAQGDNRASLERMGYDPQQMREEAVARYAEEMLARSRDPGSIAQRAAETMARAAQAIGNGLRGQGFRSADGVLRAIMQGKVGAEESGAPRISPPSPADPQEIRREDDGVNKERPRALFDEMKRRNAESRQAAEVYGRVGKSAAFEGANDLSYLVSPDLNRPPDGWRVTTFRDNEPLGHLEFDGPAAAFYEILRNRNNKPIGPNHPDEAQFSRRPPQPPATGPDLFGVEPPGKRERKEPEPTIKTDPRQQSMFGAPSAVQAQAARDQAGRGALTGKGPQQAADQGLFAPPKPPQDSLFSKRDDDGVRAYHSSPHDFDRFDMSRMGTGEGHQAFGRGLYFAENPNVARHYRRQLSVLPLWEKMMDSYDRGDSLENATHALMSRDDLTTKERALLKALEADDWLGFDYPHDAVQAVLTAPQNFDVSPATIAAARDLGHSYEVKLRHDQRRMLDWDKRLIEQPTFIQLAAKQMGLDPNRNPQATGRDLMASPDADRRLAAAGVHGVQYLDGPSRRAGSGTRNFVMFDDNLIDIVRKYAKRDEKPPHTVAEAVGRIQRLPVIGRAVTAAADKASDLGGIIRMAVAPMAEGSKETMAQAKDYANLNRLARHEASMLTSWLDKTYTPEQRRRMWEAADEQSVAMQQGQPTEGIGLDRLTPQERAVVRQLQVLSDDAFQQARQLGMIESDGLPSYVPRMVAEMVDGVARPISDKQARNLPGTMEATRTSTPHLRHREHLTTEETERAARAALDNPNVVVARDISTLPLATMKLQQAIAGRVLINQIREAGRRSGEQAVAEGAEPQDGFKWFTIRENPAFWTWRVRDGADGAKIMEKVPLYIRGDYEGPLRAVLTDRSGGALYKAWMALKGRMMTAIMWGVVHGTVIAGRISPKSPNLVRLYREGATLREDPAAMREFIMSGGVPVGHDFGYQDISGALNEGVPSNRYMSTIAARWVAGDKAANAVERANDFVHNTLTWDTIGKWQMGMFQQVKRAEIAKGADPQTAARMAAHVANRLAGAMPAEAMSAFAQKAANLLLFSRSYRIGGAGQIKDLLNGLPRDVRAQIERDQGPQAALNAQARGRRIARSVLLADLGIYVASNSLLQSAANVLLNDVSLDDELKGYVRRFLDQGHQIAENPLRLLNPFWVLDLPERLMSTSDNEPGKHARILVGREEDGTGIYVRNPAGKFPEDIFDYIQRPVQTLNRITSPFVRLGLGIFGNNKGFNRPIHDPYSGLDQSFLSNAVDIAKFVAEGVTPFTSLIEPVVDLAKKGVGVKTGNSAAMDVGKLLGSAFGVTISKGFPGGPEKGEMFAVRKKSEYDTNRAMPAIRDAIKTGEIDKAVNMMLDLHMTPREQSRVFDSVSNPSRVSPGQMRRFQMTAPDEAKERVERGRERQGIAP